MIEPNISEKYSILSVRFLIQFANFSPVTSPFHDSLSNSDDRLDLAKDWNMYQDVAAKMANA